ncbi:hypothetical protein HHI36_019117 [Cryptolaemus montrouzieri]|uniref:Uncharacterized protein n=1 Tax=Cryptolaemus montrouzieri TaxID=559131 RepID=A0ABD2P294_9CUCU
MYDGVLRLQNSLLVCAENSDDLQSKVDAACTLVGQFMIIMGLAIAVHRKNSGPMAGVLGCSIRGVMDQVSDTQLSEVDQWKHKELDYWLTQVLTGHGFCEAYRIKIREADSP